MRLAEIRSSRVSVRAIPMLKGSVKDSKVLVEQKTVPATAVQLVKGLGVGCHICGERASRSVILGLSRRCDSQV